LGASGRREVSEKLWHALDESEYEHSNTGHGDCEEEAVSSELVEISKLNGSFRRN
jgi:hypothetical protein